MLTSVEGPAACPSCVWAMQLPHSAVAHTRQFNRHQLCLGRLPQACILQRSQRVCQH